MPAFIDLTGRVFGQLTVLERAPNQGRHTMWKTRCACDSQPKSVSASHLTSGRTKSCGCFSFAQVHGFYVHDLYPTWNGMMSRCYSTNHEYYARYGGRGIRVCERWWTIENFIADVGPRPEGLQLERIDNDRGYEPGNVKWATRKENGRNKCNTVMVEYGGRTMPLTEAAERSGISPATLHTRRRFGRPLFPPQQQQKEHT